MTPEQWWDAGWKVGLPFMMVVAALVTGRKGWWVWGREIEYERKQAEKLRAEDSARQERELQDKDEELKFYRGIAFSALQQANEIKAQAQGAVTMAEQATDIIERRTARRHSA